MRILLLSLNFAPELTGIGKYNTELVEMLANEGHQIRVVCAPPYYPEWSVHQGYSPWRYSREEFPNSTTIYRVPTWTPRRPSAPKRILQSLSFTCALLPLTPTMISWRPDLVFVTEPPIAATPIALAWGKLSKAATWLHVQDFEIEAAFALNILSSKTALKLLRRFERRLMAGFDMVSTISPAMQRELLEKALPDSKIRLVPNWVDPEQIFPMRGVSRYRDELGISNDKVVVLYSGNMGKKQGLEAIVSAAERLVSCQDLIFVMCGTGAAYDELKERTASLSNVIWLPLQPLDRLNDLLNLADIHLLPQKAGIESSVLPSKLSGMLASGRAIVAMASKGSDVAAALAGAGIVVQPGDDDAFREAIMQLLRDPEVRRDMATRGPLTAVNLFGKMRVLASVNEVVDELTSGRYTKASNSGMRE